MKNSLILSEGNGDAIKIPHRSKIKQKLTHFFEEFSCSVFTGLIKVAIIQPFDFIRFRIQSGEEFKHRNPIRNLISSLLKGEGLKVFFKGVNVTSLSVLSSSIVQFTIYQQAYDRLAKKFIPGQPQDDTPVEILSTINRLSTYNKLDVSALIKCFSFTCALSGFFSGVALGLLLTPVDNIRIKLQAAQNVENASQRLYRFNSSLELIKSISTNSGVKGFYVALPISLLRECMASVIYFGSYEYMKNKEKVEHKRKRIKLHTSFMYGAFAGGVNWLITLPIDVIKTKMISDTIITGSRQYESYLDCARKVYAQEGLNGFYKGFSVVFTRALIVNGVVLTSFDVCRSAKSLDTNTTNGEIKSMALKEKDDNDFRNSNTNEKNKFKESLSVTNLSIKHCNNKGIWQEFNSTCLCLEGWVTYPKDSNKQCNYELRSHAVAIVLSFFLGGLGIDMFYLGYNISGLIKCLFPLSSLLIIISINDKPPIKHLPISYYLTLLPIGLFILMWFVDFILILVMPFDSRGLSLV